MGEQDELLLMRGGYPTIRFLLTLSHLSDPVFRVQGRFTMHGAVDINWLKYNLGR